MRDCHDVLYTFAAFPALLNLPHARLFKLLNGSLVALAPKAREVRENILFARYPVAWLALKVKPDAKRFA